MNPKKKKEKLLRKKTKNKNSATQKPTTAVRQTESKRRESSDRIHERNRGAEKDGKQSETWQAGGSRECATVPYENV